MAAAADRATADEIGNREYRPFRRVLPQLLFLACIFFLNFLSRIIFAPLLPLIEQELGFGHAVSGSFFLAISSGYFVSILLSGWVSSRITHKWTIVLSTLATGFALIILSHCVSLFSLRLTLIGLGLAAGLYLPSGLATITRTVSPSFWGRGMAVHELAPNIGFVIAPLLSGIMVEWFTWRSGLVVTGTVIILTAIFYACYGGGGKDRGQAPDLAVFRKFLAKSRFWLMVLLFSLAICSTLGIYAMLPLLLVTGQGMESETANRLLALSRLCAIAMPVPAGWLGDRSGNLPVMIAVLLLAGLLTMPLGMLSGIPLLFAVFLQPMLAVCFFPSGFAVLSALEGEENGAAVIALCIPLAFLFGGGVMPTLIGVVGDWYHLELGFVVAGLAMITAALLSASRLWREGWLTSEGNR
jgi:NNP family nitrate/nitrite transporter-like MFS transporter